MISAVLDDGFICTVQVLLRDLTETDGAKGGAQHHTSTFSPVLLHYKEKIKKHPSPQSTQSRWWFLTAAAQGAVNQGAGLA